MGGLDQCCAMTGDPAGEFVEPSTAAVERGGTRSHHRHLALLVIAVLAGALVSRHLLGDPGPQPGRRDAHGVGPWGVKYVNPEDDPSKK